MNLKPVTPARRCLAVAATGALLTMSLVGCAEAELQVGEATVGASESGASPATSPGTDGASSTPSSAPSSTPSSTSSATPAPVTNPVLETERLTVGTFALQFPLGWTAMDGVEAVASGDTSTAGGAATYSSVPAEGKDQAAWIAELMAGGSGVTGVDGNLSRFPEIIQSDGRTLFHLGQEYADNRAHLYGHVDSDVLHLLRFGLDGTEETVVVINQAVSTGVHVTS